jgi:superoxide dismutase, Fe-Mn family
MNRRDLMTSLAGAAAATTLLPGIAVAKRMPAVAFTPRAPGSHGVAPLAFDPRKLRGLSEKMITSHHDNNYAAAVKNLNKVELDLDKVNKDTPGYMVSGLRERELTFTNSMNLHERYFGNLGGDGKASGGFLAALNQQFGSAARWEELLRATAMSLGGGSGWVVVALSRLTGDLRIVGTRGHDQAVIAGEPILVLDMYEHAYQMDYGAGHAKYIDAVFYNLNWNVMQDRMNNAMTAFFASGGATGLVAAVPAAAVAAPAVKVQVPAGTNNVMTQPKVMDKK